MNSLSQRLDTDAAQLYFRSSPNIPRFLSAGKYSTSLSSTSVKPREGEEMARLAIGEHFSLSRTMPRQLLNQTRHPLRGRARVHSACHTSGVAHGEAQDVRPGTRQESSSAIASLRSSPVVRLGGTNGDRPPSLERRRRLFRASQGSPRVVGHANR